MAASRRFNSKSFDGSFSCPEPIHDRGVRYDFARPIDPCGRNGASDGARCVSRAAATRARPVSDASPNR